MLKDFVENEKFLSKFQDMLEKSSYPDTFEDWGEAANLMDAMTRARKLHINALLFAGACFTSYLIARLFIKRP